MLNTDGGGQLLADANGHEGTVTHEIPVLDITRPWQLEADVQVGFVTPGDRIVQIILGDLDIGQITFLMQGNPLDTPTSEQALAPTLNSGPLTPSNDASDWHTYKVVYGTDQILRLFQDADLQYASAPTLFDPFTTTSLGIYLRDASGNGELKVRRVKVLGG